MKHGDAANGVLRSLRGMPDILPAKASSWRTLENKIIRVLGSFGYKEIRLPLLEQTGLFARGLGSSSEIIRKEMYTIAEPGKASVSLRPESTAQVVRSVLENHLYEGSIPLRLFYLGPMFRRERPQAGRQRQFHQLGGELIGHGEKPLYDAEIICLCSAILEEAGLQGYEIQVNHLGCAQCRDNFKSRLGDYFKPLREDLCPDCQRKYDTNILRILKSAKKPKQKNQGTPKTN